MNSNNAKIKNRIHHLRQLMNDNGYDAVIVPTGDYHMSEYTGDYFKCREFITGFTGSAGTAVIFRDAKLAADGLWTDSRYYIQAEKQLEGTGISLFKIGYSDTPSVISHLINTLPEGGKVSCDGRVISFDDFASWYDALEDAGIFLDEQRDLIGEIWNAKTTGEDRPSLPHSPAFEYDIKYCGRSRREKLDWLAVRMQDLGASDHLLTSLDDIAWLLNIRGGDVHCNPVVMSYLLASANISDSAAGSHEASQSGSEQASHKLDVRLFADERSFDDELISSLKQDGVRLLPYDSIDEALSELQADSLLLSAADTNSYLYGVIPPAVYIIEDENPTSMAKAVKNNIEIENAKSAHLKDGVALTKFMYWLKTNVTAGSSTSQDGAAVNSSSQDGAAENSSSQDGASTKNSNTAESNSVTEISAAAKLYQLRSQQENFLGNSFDPIIAYGAHGAIVHYSATEESNVALEPKGLVLCDTGGHYLEGTTDVTRTIALGPLTDEELKMSTAVLKGHIALAGAVFPKGLNGGNLDYLAHAPLWEMGKDYGHGTGHGVGHLLSVHEGPNYIHWSRNGNTGTTPPFEPGMITSCEPGYYEDGKFGIRHESLILCKPYSLASASEAVASKTRMIEKSKADTAGDLMDDMMDDMTENSIDNRVDNSTDMLCFEELTMVPFDLDAIDIDALTEKERNFINEYHAIIFERISPYLTEDEYGWLKTATAKI